MSLAAKQYTSLEAFSDEELSTIWQSFTSHSDIDFEWCEAVYSEISRRGGLAELQRKVSAHEVFIDHHIYKGADENA
jgi:hypothetical protein